MSDIMLTFDDWLNHKLIDIRKIIGKSVSYSGPVLPFHAVYTDRNLSSDFLASGVISDVELKKIQDAQQYAADLLFNHWKKNGVSHAEKFIEKSGGNKSALKDEIDRLGKRLSSLEEYHRTIPTFEYIGVIADLNKFTILVDPDLYKQLVVDHEKGNGIRPYLTFPEDYPVDEGDNIKAIREQLIRQSYPLPKLSTDNPGFNFSQTIINQRQAIDYVLSSASVKYQIDILNDEWAGKTKVKKQGSKSYLDKIVPEDAFFEYAKKLFQEGKVVCLTKHGKPSSDLVKRLERKGFKGYTVRDKERPTEKELKFKVIRQRLIDDTDRWKVK